MRGKPCLWLTVEIKEQMNKRDQLLRKWRTTKSPTDKRNYQNKRNLVNIMLRSAKGNHIKSFSEKMLINHYVLEVHKTNFSNKIELNHIQ